MSRLRITHRTVYRYREPVGLGLHRLVVRPREGHDLQVVRHRLRIQPRAAVTWHRDLFGNSVAWVQFLEETTRLELTNEVTVNRADHASSRALFEVLPVRLPPVYSPQEQPVARGYLEPVYPDEAAGLADWVRRHFEPRERDDAVHLVHEIGLWIYKAINYRRREERGVQSPLRTLELGSGSCRDMATLMLEGVRALGLATRFASGYLDSPASEAGRAATHAWMEVYLPDHGWFGFDPTLGEATSLKHIVTGVSSHPRGVMPVSGSYLGSPASYLGMTVSVKIEKLGPSRELVAHNLTPAPSPGEPVGSEGEGEDDVDAEVVSGDKGP
jgi:transglutaminase-like putative cysteine protease